MSNDKKYAVLVHIPEWNYTLESSEMSEDVATSLTVTYARLKESGYGHVRFLTETGDMVILNRYMLERCLMIVKEKKGM